MKTPWLNPLMTGTPPNNTNTTPPISMSPSAPSLLTAGTVLAVASSNTNNNNNTSPNNTLRKKKGTPIKSGWLRLNNTIKWFELLKYKMIYYASNNEVKSRSTSTILRTKVTNTKKYIGRGSNRLSQPRIPMRRINETRQQCDCYCVPNRHIREALFDWFQRRRDTSVVCSHKERVE